jgi:hypothetical protein
MEYSKGKNAWKALSIMGEYVDTKDILEDFKKLEDSKAITVFGSARLKKDSKDYQLCEEFTNKLSQKGYSIITGGGPGIMEAANKGSYDFIKSSHHTDVKSIGIGIELPFESGNNKYISHGYSMSLKYFFIRKTMLINYSDAFVVFKGGLGTLDELFEAWTLMQTGKIKKRPIYLVNSQYWSGLIDWIKTTMIEQSKTVSEKDLNLIHVIDNYKDIDLKWLKYGKH